jgi:hypothetical protein
VDGVGVVRDRELVLGELLAPATTAEAEQHQRVVRMVPCLEVDGDDRPGGVADAR